MTRSPLIRHIGYPSLRPKLAMFRTPKVKFIRTLKYPFRSKDPKQRLHAKFQPDRSGTVADPNSNLTEYAS